MATTTYIVQWDNDQPVKLHVVATPTFRDPGFYRQTASLNAFRRNIHKQGADALLQRREGARRFHVRWKDEFEMDLESEARNVAMLAERGKTLRARYATLPRIEHADPKAFYATIGYNPARRKLLPAPRKEAHDQI